MQTFIDLAEAKQLLRTTPDVNDPKQINRFKTALGVVTGIAFAPPSEETLIKIQEQEVARQEGNE